MVWTIVFYYGVCECVLLCGVVLCESYCVVLDWIINTILVYIFVISDLSVFCLCDITNVLE